MIVGKRLLRGTHTDGQLVTAGLSKLLGLDNSAGLTPQMKMRLIAVRQDVGARADTVWLPLRRRLWPTHHNKPGDLTMRTGSRLFKSDSEGDAYMMLAELSRRLGYEALADQLPLAAKSLRLQLTAHANILWSHLCARLEEPPEET